MNFPAKNYYRINVFVDFFQVTIVCNMSSKSVNTVFFFY
jgi:hypothetical protein